MSAIFCHVRSGTRLGAGYRRTRHCKPSGLLLGAVMMLVHIGQGDVAAKIHNAWLKTIEDGIHTGEIYNPKLSSAKVGTDGMREAIIERLGQKPSTLHVVDYSGGLQAA